jgi:hypothetical protein
MTTAEDVLQVARRQIGTKESPPSTNSNKYGNWYGMDRAPWCAMFVSYCFYNAGLPLPITTPKGFAYCPYGVQWFRNKGWWQSQFYTAG